MFSTVRSGRVQKLDPDSGMIFVWQSPVQEGFWMKDTYIPLQIAQTKYRKRPNR